VVLAYVFFCAVLGALLADPEHSFWFYLLVVCLLFLLVGCGIGVLALRFRGSQANSNTGILNEAEVARDLYGAITPTESNADSSLTHDDEGLRLGDQGRFDCLRRGFDGGCGLASLASSASSAVASWATATIGLPLSDSST